MIAETPAGTVWVATDAGLAWYDGFRWVPMGVRNGLPEQAPRSMEADLADGILAVFEAGLYHGDRNGFRRMPVRRDGVDLALLAALPLADDRWLLVASDEASTERLFVYGDTGPRAVSRA